MKNYADTFQTSYSHKFSQSIIKVWAKPLYNCTEFVCWYLKFGFYSNVNLLKSQPPKDRVGYSLRCFTLGVRVFTFEHNEYQYHKKDAPMRMFFNLPELCVHNIAFARFFFKIKIYIVYHVLYFNCNLLWLFICVLCLQKIHASMDTNLFTKNCLNLILWAFFFQFLDFKSKEKRIEIQ